LERERERERYYIFNKEKVYIVKKYVRIKMREKNRKEKSERGDMISPCPTITNMDRRILNRWLNCFKV
jgi:hypothetical protein